MSQAGLPVFRYSFVHAFQMPGAWGPNNACNGYACHGVEIPFVFDSASLIGLIFWPDEILLSQTVMSYWGNFATHGNPNGAHLPGESA